MIAIGSSWDPFERIKETARNLRYLDSLEQFETARFAKCKFARPVSIVPLAMTGFNKSLQFSNIPVYLQTINFPSGEEIDGYTHDGETYFPLTRADLDELNDNHRELKLRNLTDKYASLESVNLTLSKLNNSYYPTTPNLDYYDTRTNRSITRKSSNST